MIKNHANGGWNHSPLIIELEIYSITFFTTLFLLFADYRLIYFEEIWGYFFLQNIVYIPYANY